MRCCAVNSQPLLGEVTRDSPLARRIRPTPTDVCPRRRNNRFPLSVWRRTVHASLPLQNVSWNALMRADGFLQRVNDLVNRRSLSADHEPLVFRLPTEAEWEYAARGGPHWRDDFAFSGSQDIDRGAWYDRRHGDGTMPVALKAPNQLGLHDMSGNVREWCHDSFTPDVSAPPHQSRHQPQIHPHRTRCCPWQCR